MSSGLLNYDNELHDASNMSESLSNSLPKDDFPKQMGRLVPHGIRPLIRTRSNTIYTRCPN